MVRINKLTIQFNFKNILNDFAIVKFTTTEKYIPNGAQFLDELPTQLKVKSIVFSGDIGEKSLYTLFLKSEFEKIDFRKELNSLDKGDVLILDKMSTEIDIQKIPTSILCQLLINSLSSPMVNRYRFNNLSGHFFHFHSNNYELRNSDTKDIILQIKGLQIKTNIKQELELNVKTFSSLFLVKSLGFTSQNPVGKYPKYTFSHSTQTLRRILNSETVDTLNTFVIKQMPKKKSSIPFLNFKSLNEFNASKMGALFSLVEKIKENLNQYLIINFDVLENLTFIRHNEQITKEKQLRIKDICSKLKLNLIDDIQDDYSEHFITKIIPFLTSYFDATNIEKTNKINSKHLNIRLIHDKKHYETYQQKDKYKISNNSAVHHITFEDFKIKDQSVDNIIKELILKHDIIKRQISIIDWSKYQFQNRWIFGCKKEDIFYFLTIHSKGELTFDTFEPNLFNKHEFDRYCEIFENNPAIEGIIINSNNEINSIEKTTLFTIPDYEVIAQAMHLEDKEHTFEKNDLIEMLKKSEIDEKRKREYIHFFEQQSQTQILKSELLNFITHRTDRKKLSDTIFEQTGILLRAYLKGLDRYDILASNLDIVTYSTEEGMFYFVGTKGKGIQSQIPRASILRKIQAENQSPIFFNQLTELMNVDFVKNGDLTIKPFPFKYLEEWIKMNPKKQTN